MWVSLRFVRQNSNAGHFLKASFQKPGLTETHSSTNDHTPGPKHLAGWSLVSDFFMWYISKNKNKLHIIYTPKNPHHQLYNIFQMYMLACNLCMPLLCWIVCWDLLDPEQAALADAAPLPRHWPRPRKSVPFKPQITSSRWWFQPIWNILVKLDHLPQK